MRPALARQGDSERVISVGFRGTRPRPGDLVRVVDDEAPTRRTRTGWLTFPHDGDEPPKGLLIIEVPVGTFAIYLERRGNRAAGSWVRALTCFGPLWMFDGAIERA